MNTIRQYEVKLPEYALSYVVNNDCSEVQDSDKKLIDQWIDSLNTEVDNLNCYDVIINPKDQDSYFSWAPVFGLACTVVDTDILFVR